MTDWLTTTRELEAGQFVGRPILVADWMLPGNMMMIGPHNVVALIRGRIVTMTRDDALAALNAAGTGGSNDE